MVTDIVSTSSATCSWSDAASLFSEVMNKRQTSSFRCLSSVTKGMHRDVWTFRPEQHLFWLNVNSLAMHLHCNWIIYELLTGRQILIPSALGCVHHCSKTSHTIRISIPRFPVRSRSTSSHRVAVDLRGQSQTERIQLVELWKRFWKTRRSPDIRTLVFASKNTFTH